MGTYLLSGGVMRVPRNLLGLALWVSFSPLNAAPGGARNEEVLLLVVDKSKLQATLKTWPENPQDAKDLLNFRVAIGKKEGDKLRQGDNKTPEGIYMAQKILDGRNLPSRYGPKAIPINFPNPVDRLRGKTGYGIWLHGVEKDQRIEESKVTEGCVAFYNADIEILTRWLDPKQSMVMITHDASLINKPEDSARIREKTNAWLSSWQKRELELYMDYYHRDFVYKGKNWDRYRDYKDRVFNSYQNMSVTLESLRVFVHDQYALAMMNQDFNGDDRYISSGRKLLYWQKLASGEWKIIREVFDERRMTPSVISMIELAETASKSPSAKYFTPQDPEKPL